MTTEELNALIAQAEGGDVSAMNQLGQIYGGNEFKDFEKAFYWHKKAAELGNVNSMSNLGGWCYLQGNGTEKNIPLADEWLKKSVENGWVWTWAFNELANIFANDAQYKDLSKAFYWYTKSADAGDRIGMSNLGGWCYLWGNGVEKDVDKAIYWLSKAADECGDIWSMNKLTYIYGELEGYINNEQAAKWLLTLIQNDCDPNSGVYENTGYNKDLYEKIKNAILNSASENDMSSLSGSSSGGSLFGGAISIASSNAKSYINQAEELLTKKVTAERDKLISLIEKDYGWKEKSPFQEMSGTFMIPEGTKRIGEGVFHDCSGLTSIIIPNSVTSIGDSAFHDCNGLTSIAIPKSVTVCKATFYYCNKLSSVNINSNACFVGFGAFSENFNSDVVKSITIGDDVTTIGIWGLDDFNVNTPVYNTHIFARMPTNYSGAYTIPDGVTSVGNYAFWRCSGLTSIIIPNSVTSIGDSAFHDCNGLSSIIIPDSVTSIGKNAFVGCKSLAGVKLGKGILNIGEDAFGNCNLSMIIIPKGTRKRFENMEGLKGLESKIVEE